MPTLTAAQFRRALGQFATGVAVVTVEREAGRVHGMTANSFASVSLKPLLILVCVDQRARLLTLLEEKRRFGVSVLSAEQEALSEYFAKPEQDAESAHRLGIHFHWTEERIPVIEGALAQLACQVAAAHVSGDHTIFVGEVESAIVHRGEPLLFWGGEYRRLAPQTKASR